MVHITSTAPSAVQLHHHAESGSDPVLDGTSPPVLNDVPRSEQPLRTYPESPSARQKFSDMHQRPADVNALLKNVQRDTSELARDAFTSDIAAAPNGSGMQCIEATMVSVPLQDKHILCSHTAHINQINFSPDAETPDRTSLYRKGQSPAGPVATTPQSTTATTLSSACEKALVEGIDSGLGLYQFVSRRAHYHPRESRETPIIGAISQLWHNRKEGEPVILGGRYEVTGFQEQGGSAVDRLHCLLEVRDLQNPVNMRTVPLTQAGLQFTGRLLKAREIETANAILDAHRALGTAQLHAPPRQAEPTVYSYAGIGRNATLIMYRRMASLITDGKITDGVTLANELREAIRIGRTACGKRFLHSNAQINELWKSLSRALLNAAAGKKSEKVYPSRESVSTASMVEHDELHQDIEFAATSGAMIARVSPTEPTTEFANAPSAEATTAASTAAKTEVKTEVKTEAATDHSNVTSGEPAVVERASTQTTTPSTRLGNLTFANLESADNEFHQNWNIAFKLLKEINSDRGVRFQNAFNVSERCKLIKHLSKRQLAAVLAHIGVPQNDQGFVLSDFLLENLNASELFMVRTLPKFTPAIAADSLEKSKRDAKLAEEADGFEALVRRCQNGEVVGHNVRALPFMQSSFLTWDNGGGGNCLFHALHSEFENDTLPRADLRSVREKTALVRLHMPDGEAQSARNWNEMMVSTGNETLKKIFHEYGIPEELSNVQFADLQRRSGLTSGDVEIEQWLAIPRNPTKSVVIIDGLNGGEAIVSFTRDEDQNVVREAVKLSEISEINYPYRSGVRQRIAEAISDAIKHRESRQHLALYRMPGHYVRIVGLLSLDESRRYWNAA